MTRARALLSIGVAMSVLRERLELFHKRNRLDVVDAIPFIHDVRDTLRSRIGEPLYYALEAEIEERIRTILREYPELEPLTHKEQSRGT